MIDSTGLDAELRAAGLRIHGCASTGRIDWIDPPTPAEEATAAQVLAAHDPTKRQLDLDADDAERRIALGNLVTAHRDWDTLGTAARWAAVRLCIRVVILIARGLLS